MRLVSMRNCPARRVLSGLALVASVYCATAAAEVIDNIVIERHASTARIRLHLAFPVHYIRHYVSANGDAANVYLQSLAPPRQGQSAIPEEVKRPPYDALVPRFTARVSLDPRCEPVPHPVCVVVQFERPTRFELRLGEDRRTLLLDVPIESGEDENPASAGNRT